MNHYLVTFLIATGLGSFEIVTLFDSWYKHNRLQDRATFKLITTLGAYLGLEERGSMS